MYNGHKNKFTIKKLEPNTKYKYRVRPVKVNKENEKEMDWNLKWGY